MRRAVTPTQVARAEYFESYRERLWHPAQPLVVLHQRFEGGIDTGTYRHEDFYALYVVQRGHGIHRINGHPYPVVAGNVYITPPGSTHGYGEYQDLRAEAFCFQAHLFAPEELDALRRLEGFWRLFVPVEPARLGTFDHYQLHLSPEGHRRVGGMIAEIAAEMAQPPDLAAILVRGLLFRLMVYLARAQTAWQTERGVPARPACPTAAAAHGLGIAEVLRVCEERLAEPLSVPGLAALMFLSPGHFSALFAREVGSPPAAYIRRLRLERAQALLRGTPRSATEIAHECGFADLAQLSRAFRAAFGLTPTAYRRRYRE